MLLFGAAAQFGIFFTMVAAVLLGFDLADAASIGIIGAADGPTSILVSQVLHSSYVRPHRRRGVLLHGARADHPALRHQARDDEKGAPHPDALQPQERLAHLRICFPILATIIAGFIAPMSVSARRLPDVR